MNRKALLVIFLVLIFSITGMGTYAFLVNKSSNPNVITTGNFPAKFNVKLYAASGPVFKDNQEGHQNNYSISYPVWLNDASKYILKDLTGQILATTPPSNKYETYTNIDGGKDTPSRKKTIVSANFYSWEGKSLNKDTEVESDKKELMQNGTTLHHIVLLENSRRLGDIDSPKIKLDDLSLEGLTVSISQYDSFRGMNTQKEYRVERSSSFLNPGDSDSKSRVRTFDYVNNQYVQTFSVVNKEQPANEADLIIFDAGGRGYYAHPSDVSLSEQQALDDMFDRLCGAKPFESTQNTHPFDTNIDAIIRDEGGLVRLESSVSEVTVKKNGKNVIAPITNKVIFSNQE